jgi:hypothetical protein
MIEIRRGFRAPPGDAGQGLFSASENSRKSVPDFSPARCLDLPASATDMTSGHSTARIP